MSQFLFDVQQKNRLKQKGLLKRFSINCYGKQLTIERIREEKALKYKELKNNRGSKEWDFYFLKYSPGDNEGRNTKNNKKKKKRKIKNKPNTKKKQKPKRKRTKRTRKRKTRWHKRHDYLF
jgi:hypothetical protein